MAGHPVSPTVAPGKARLDLQISFNEEGSESGRGGSRKAFLLIYLAVSQLQHKGSRALGSVAPGHVGSWLRTRDGARVLSFGRRILNHWTTWQVPREAFYFVVLVPPLFWEWKQA